VHEWDVLHAAIFKTSGWAERCLFALQVVAVTAVLLGVADVLLSDKEESGEVLQALIPGALILLGVVRLGVCAAVVTAKCDQAPSILNSLSLGPGTNRAKQRVVQHILNSSAGFYVFGVRLTTGIVLRFLYFGGVVIFTLLTRILASS